MNPFSITISNSNGTDALSLNKLNRAIYMIVAAQTATDFFENAPEILRLHEHKGELQVYWKDKPTKENILAIGMIWELMGELSMNVLHGHPGITENERFQLSYSDEYYH